MVIELVKHVKPDQADNTSFLRVEELAFEQLRLADPYVGHAGPCNNRSPCAQI